MYKVGIVGGSGYTAGELIRVLLDHPKVEIVSVYSTTNAGKKVSDIHDDLLAYTDLKFSQEIPAELDILFLCLGHGNSKKFLTKVVISDQTKVIDLSTDFRDENDAIFHNRKFIYGLPELDKTAIRKANSIANPGCFATAIQLGLLPLAKRNKLIQTVHVHALTGSTGAGLKPSNSGHFSHRLNNVSWYKAFDHQHLQEIKKGLAQEQSFAIPPIVFLPIRGDFARGIFATLYTPFDESIEDAKSLYQEYFSDDPFTIISDGELHLKQVVNTNFCFIHLVKKDGLLLITSIIDNLLKGASGQAIQNMNLMLGIDEMTGLKLKANYF